MWLLFSQRIIIGTANLLWWTTTIYLSLFWWQQSQFQHFCATSSEPWTPNQTLLKMYRIESLTFSGIYCSGEFPYWPCPMLPRNLSMPLGMIILLGNISTILTDCWSSGETVYMYIYIFTHINTMQSDYKKIVKLHMYMETQNVEYPLRWSWIRGATWHMALGSSFC